MSVKPKKGNYSVTDKPGRVELDHEHLRVLAGTFDPLKYNEGQTYNKTFKTLIFNILKTVKNSFATIVLDWFEIHCYCREMAGENAEKLKLIISRERVDQGVLLLDDGFKLIEKVYGTKQFESTFDVYYNGKMVGYIQAFARRPEQWRTGSILFKVANDVLYQRNMLEIVYKFLQVTGLEINNVNRLDIAIDFERKPECRQHIPELFNYLLRQSGNNPQMIFKGKAQFNPLHFNQQTMTFPRFVVGSVLSDKLVTFYPKSLELERSHKEYIREFWKSSGMNLTDDVYRAEIRCKSKGIHTVKDLEIDRLDEPEYLASIFRTLSEDLLTLRVVNQNDTNKRRWEEAKIIDWKNLCAELLDKTKKPKTDDSYKLRLALHFAVKHGLHGAISEREFNLLLDGLLNQVFEYGLVKKMHKWADLWLNKYAKVEKIDRLTGRRLTKEEQAEAETLIPEPIKRIRATVWLLKALPSTLDKATAVFDRLSVQHLMNPGLN